MPCYSWRCQACGCSFDLYNTINDRDEGEDCPDCGSAKVRREVTAAAVRPDADDFSHENGGAGRYNPQIKKYVRHVNDVKDYAKRTGYSYST